jgi:hypothetical protein
MLVERLDGVVTRRPYREEAAAGCEQVTFGTDELAGSPKATTTVGVTTSAAAAIPANQMARTSAAAPANLSRR